MIDVQDIATKIRGMGDPFFGFGHGSMHFGFTCNEDGDMLHYINRTANNEDHARILFPDKGDTIIVGRAIIAPGLTSPGWLHIPRSDYRKYKIDSEEEGLAIIKEVVRAVRINGDLPVCRGNIATKYEVADFLNNFEPTFGDHDLQSNKDQIKATIPALSYIAILGDDHISTDALVMDKYDINDDLVSGKICARIITEVNLTFRTMGDFEDALRKLAKMAGGHLSLRQLHAELEGPADGKEDQG